MTNHSIRDATPDDVEALAQIHVQAWRETYHGLLPAAEIARRDLATRRAQWTNQIAARASRIVIARGLGFVQFGPQRAPDLKDDWPNELYAIYVLRAAQGTGLAWQLMEHVAGRVPFTALVLKGNDRALAFYRKTGATILGERQADDGHPDILLGWPIGCGDRKDHAS